jgi:hypothetical protein
VTAVAEDLDLSWVTFSAGPDDCCHWRQPGPCALEAIAEAIWDRDCCGTTPRLFCAGHRDRTADDSLRRDGWFCCIGCRASVRLLRIEPLR